MTRYAISPENNELIEKLAKAAFERYCHDRAATLLERLPDAGEPIFYVTWGHLPEHDRVGWRYGVHEALVAWSMSGEMEGELQFPDEF